MVNGAPHLLGWFMVAAALIPVADGTIVLRSRGPKAAAYGIHWSTTALMLACGLLLTI